MTDFTARLRDVEQRTDKALGSLEQDNQWAEAMLKSKEHPLSTDYTD